MLTGRRSYRFKANLTLTGVFLLVLVSLGVQHQHPKIFFLQLLTFTLEAALVGGLADWFAVTALFRRPLGWPFHTALIPRNRDKVIEGIKHLVEENLLSSELIEAKISEIHPTRQWAAATPPETLHHASRAFSRTLRTRLRAFNPEVAADFLAESLKDYLKRTSLTPYVIDLLQTIRDKPDNVVNFALTQLIHKMSAPNTKEGIKRYLNTHKEVELADSPLNRTLFRLLESVDALNLEDAAGALQEQICTSLHALYDHAHPLRQLFDSSIQTLIDSLDFDTFKSLEQWKSEVLLAYPWEKTFAHVITALQEELALDEAPLSRWLDGQMENLFKQFAENAILQQTLDHYLQTSLLRLARANRHWVGQIARNTLETFSNADLNAFIEEKAGNDLQWIRINGSLVGGIIGFTLFIILHVIGKLVIYFSAKG